MAHEVESMCYFGQVPWHGLGDTISDPKNIDLVLKEAHIDWEVELRAIAVYGIDAIIPKFWALTRTSDNKVFDITGDRYVPVQNAEAIEFFRDFVEAGNATLETAGSLRGGQYVWALANLHADFALPGQDVVKNYVLVGKPHEQGKSLIFRRTGIRVVCHNTLTMALRDRHAAEFRMAHRRSFGDKEIEKARLVLDLARDDVFSFEQDARKLYELELNTDQVLRIITPIMSPNTDDEDLQMMIDDPSDYTPRIKAIMDSYFNAPGALPGSGWGVLNAITHYADHVASRTQDQRLTNAWFGKTARQKTLVMSELLALTA